MEANITASCPGPAGKPEIKASSTQRGTRCSTKAYSGERKEETVVDASEGAAKWVHDNAVKYATRDALIKLQNKFAKQARKQLQKMKKYDEKCAK